MIGKIVYSQKKLLELRNEKKIYLDFLNERPKKGSLRRKPSAVSSLEKKGSILQDNKRLSTKQNKRNTHAAPNPQYFRSQHYYEDEENGDILTLSSQRCLKEPWGLCPYFDNFFGVPLVEGFAYFPLFDISNSKQTVYATMFQGYLVENLDRIRPREDSPKQYAPKRNTKEEINEKKCRKKTTKNYPRYHTTSMYETNTNHVPHQFEEVANSSNSANSLHTTDRETARIDSLSGYESSSDSSIYIKISP